jgi:GTPase SAR1 family protein
MRRARRGAPTFILVGNKADKTRQREVAIVEGRQRAIAWGCAFFETSAKIRDGVEEAFTRIVRELRETAVEKPEVAKEPGCWGGCVIL